MDFLFLLSVSCFLFLVPCSMFLVSCFLFLVHGSLILGNCSLFSFFPVSYILPVSFILPVSNDELHFVMHMNWLRLGCLIENLLFISRCIIFALVLGISSCLLAMFIKGLLFLPLLFETIRISWLRNLVLVQDILIGGSEFTFILAKVRISLVLAIRNELLFHFHILLKMLFRRFEVNRVTLAT